MATKTSTVRPYADSDFADLLALLRAAEPVPGQPLVTDTMLEQALEGTSPIDGGWWAELKDLRHLVLPARGGGLVGAAAVGVSKADGAGYVLWLSGEGASGVDIILDAALEALAGTPVQRAFSFATALGDGLEALPARLRPEVDQALVRHGFRGEDLWVYMRRSLGDSADTFLAEHADSDEFVVTAGDEPRSWSIAAPSGADQGVVEVGVLPSGTGILEWLHVDEAQRGRGLGRAVLRAGLRHLASLEVREVILYVDHDAPGTERDRSSALGLYEAVGFEVVDHLYSYERAGS